jgi:hypothetical protein
VSRVLRSRVSPPDYRLAGQLADLGVVDQRGPGATFLGACLTQYPGERAVRAWARASPHRFLVFPIGNGPATEWPGRSTFLRRLGWGLAILYAPRIAERSSHSGQPIPLSRSAGAADGYDAIACARSEGIRPGAVCYLDLTALLPGDRGGGGAVQDYCKGWMGTVLDSGSIQPGTRCRHGDAPVIATAMRAVYGERRRAVQRAPLWITDARGLARSGLPADAPLVSTGPDQDGWRADIWEGEGPEGGRIRETYEGVTLSLHPCRASRPDPSFDMSVVDPATYAAVLRPRVTPSPHPEVASATANEARGLMEACLSVLAVVQTGGASPFPNGVAAVEVETSERNGETGARIRVLGPGSATCAQRDDRLARTDNPDDPVPNLPSKGRSADRR